MSFLQVSKTALLNCLNSLNLRQQQQSREVNQRLPSFAAQNNNQQQQLSVKHDLRVLCASVCFCVLLAAANNNKTTTTRAPTRPHARCESIYLHLPPRRLLHSKSVTAFVKRRNALCREAPHVSTRLTRSTSNVSCKLGAAPAEAAAAATAAACNTASSQLRIER
eukprot:scaffold86489_cov78-Phaeocystis_antarctica.AAC.1